MFGRQNKILNRYNTLQGTLALFLLFFKPLFWLGTLLHVASIAPVEARAEEARNTLEGDSGAGLAVPLTQKIEKISPAGTAFPQTDLPPLESLEGLEHVAYRVKPGDTLSRVLTRFGVPLSERQEWIRSYEKHSPIRGLSSGKEMHFYFSKTDKPSPNNPKGRELLKALEIELDEDWNLTWEKGPKGILFSKREKPYDLELKTVGGIAETSLFSDGQRAGLHSALLSQLADIFNWDIDFEKQSQKGRTFKILYEQKTRQGKNFKTSFRILAAELINAGRQYFAIYFEKEKGRGSYYDLDGRSLARAFLRFPLEFTSISSHFSHSRFHPILKVDRPHYGVDFAAKRGTPIRAIGNGKIVHAGWKKGGYGRMIEIEHDSVHASRYAHLQGFAKGIKTGATVKKGQIIGYVGSSGRATAPHLHFELYKGQEYIDPLQFDVPPEDNIEPALRRYFESAKQLFLAELAFGPQS